MHLGRPHAGRSPRRMHPALDVRPLTPNEQRGQWAIFPRFPCVTPGGTYVPPEVTSGSRGARSPDSVTDVVCGEATSLAPSSPPRTQPSGGVPMQRILGSVLGGSAKRWGSASGGAVRGERPDHGLTRRAMSGFSVRFSDRASESSDFPSTRTPRCDRASPDQPGQVERKKRRCPDQRRRLAATRCWHLLRPFPSHPMRREQPPARPQ